MDGDTLETEVDCLGRRHRIRWESGRLILLEHGTDTEADDIVAVLSGAQSGCPAFARAWKELDDDTALSLAHNPRYGMFTGLLPTGEVRSQLSGGRRHLTSEQRRTVDRVLDQMVFTNLIVGLGEPFARQRAREALTAIEATALDRRQRKGVRIQLALLAARRTGARRHNIVLGPRWFPGLTRKIGPRVFGLVSLRWGRRAIDEPFQRVSRTR